MVPSEPPPVHVCPRGSSEPGGDPVRTVVWVRGEHDMATKAHLSSTIDAATRLDAADVVVDLSGVVFMDASTITSMVVAHRQLRAGPRSLTVRDPSPFARRVLDVCDLAFLIDGHEAAARHAAAPALGSWVAVPASDPPPNRAPSPIDQPTRATSRRSGQPAESLPQPRASP